MNAPEVAYIAASAGVTAAVTAGAVVIRSAVKELASVLRDGSQAGYTASLSFSVKPPAQPKEGEFTADASRFQSALDEALEDAARTAVAALAGTAPPQAAEPSSPGAGPSVPLYEPLP